MALRRIYDDSNGVLTGQLKLDSRGVNDFAMEVLVAPPSTASGSAGGIYIGQKDGGESGLKLDISSYGIALQVGQTGNGTACQIQGKTELSGGVFLPQTSGATPAANGATPVAVANVNTTLDSIVLFSLNTVGGTPGLPRVSSKTPGVGFSFASDAGDTSTYNYVIFN
jgi:hypothetical protein